MVRLDYKRYTENTVSGFEELRKQLQEFRLQGYAIDDQEIEEGLWCLAVPVYDGYHRMVAAISVSGPKSRMVGKMDLIKTEMLKAGKNLSRDLGYQKEDK